MKKFFEELSRRLREGGVESSNVEDILLVFMYDRLGRNLNETPFIAEWFTKKGIHVWSVYEGEIIDGVDAERMLDYIRFWQTDEAQKL